MSDRYKSRILIIDDDEAVRDSMVDFFEDRDWFVMAAETAEIALNLLDEETFDCALVDIRLPGMDGNDFIRKALEKENRLVYIICTGSPEYGVPADLQMFENVSKSVYQKPVTDMYELENDFINLLKDMTLR